MQLDPLAVRSGVRLEAHDELGSTNEEALVRARTGATGPLWVTAQCQTAGRGRRGRTWMSPRGNLYATLLLTEPSPPERAAELSLVAALAVRDAIVAVAPSLATLTRLKWPNDVLIEGKKVAGILVEGEMMRPRGIAVAIGMGVNCADHPDNTAYPATDLANAGAPATPADLFGALSRHMVTRSSQWDRGAGFAAIRADWLTHAAGQGDEIEVALADRRLSGCFQTLDDAGRLVLALPDGTRELITAGDVFLPAASAVASTPSMKQGPGSPASA